MSCVEVGARLIVGVGDVLRTYVAVGTGDKLVNVDSGVFADVGTCVTLSDFAINVAATAVSSAIAVSVPATRVAMRSGVDVGKAVEASDVTSHARTPTRSMTSVSQYVRLFILQFLSATVARGQLSLATGRGRDGHY